MDASAAPWRPRLVLAVVVIVVAGLVVAAVRSCGDDGDSGGATSSTTAAAPSSTTASELETVTTGAPTTALPPTTAAPVPSPAGSAVEIRQGSTDQRVVALTFDAGSDAGHASAILDVLEREQIRASFGITGDWARSNARLVARMAGDGHLLLNHTDRHRSFTGASTGDAPLDSADRRAELDRAAAAISAAGGGAVAPWFRPPYGDSDASVLRDVGAAGYRWSVLWTVDSLGWKGIPVDQIVERCVSGAAPGAIYLFHVGSASRDGEALPTIIDRLRRAGYRFVGVDRLARDLAEA